MKNDLQAGLQNIIDAINNLIEPKLGSLRYDKTFRAKIISDEGNNVYGVQINGKNYKAVYTGEKIPVGQIVKVKAPLNNFSDIYIETLPGSGSGSAGNYNDLLNKPILNTNNTGTQVPSATETIQGTISLHKVSKTGNYNDLLNKPTLDFIPTSEKGGANGVAGLDENKKVSKSNLPTDTVYDNNYVHTDNNFTTAMKNKLDSVEEGAEPNKIEIIQRNGSVLPINNKIVNVEVPTKTSDLTNDNGFISSIPVASATILGGIKVGENLSITADGVLSAKGGGTTDYSVLLNKPVLNTANTKSLAVDSNETINGIVSLHKISKTGSYEDLLNKPTIPTKTSDLTNNGDGTTGSKYITNTDLNAELESKQDKITGGATTIVTNDLTVNRALVSNANGKVAVSNTTSTELGYLSGARSNLQTQIDAITTEGGQPNVIEVVQENGTPLEVNNKTVNVIVPTNLVNGTKIGSLRTVGATPEDSKYKLGRYAFAEGGRAIGFQSHSEGHSQTGRYCFAIVSGDSTAKTYTLSSVTGLSVNMKYSIHMGTSGAIDTGIITAIDTENNVVTVNYYEGLREDNNYFYIYDRPDIGDISYIEASNNGTYSHAEGTETYATGDYSHTEGWRSKALGDSAHAEGYGTIARGDNTHAEGMNTVANGRYQHVQGKYNIADTTSLDIIGNGTTNNNRSNAYTLDTNGNAWYSGEVYVGSTSGTNKDSGSVKLAKITDLDTKVDKTTTIAGINLQDNITVSELADALKVEMLKIENPVGHIRMETTNTNPATYLGFGTWVLWGSGRVPVGIDTTQTEFNTVEKTGGEKTHTLTLAQIPSHTHTFVGTKHTHSIPAHSHGLNSHTHTVKAHSHTFSGTTSGTGVSVQGILTYPNTLTSNVSNEGKILGGAPGNAWATNATFRFGSDTNHTHTYSGTTSTVAQFNTDAASGNTADSSVLTSGEATQGGTNSNSGGGEAHNNLQPYITCYMWKRTV